MNDSAKDNRSMPKVSVVIPLYNCADYIGKAIESILAQTYADWELLICEDGSRDESLKIAHTYEQADPRIKILENGKNKGYVFTYNRLLFAATGDYIMIQDADDWSAPERMERQLGILTRFGADLCFCSSAFYLLAERDEAHYGPEYPSGFIDIHSPETYDPATMFFKREILQTVPGYHTYFDRLVAMDRYFTMECLDQFKGYYLHEHLYHVLIRPDSDHRSLDERYKRKLSALEAYRLLKKQRQETGTDWLKEGRVDELIAYEQSLLKNDHFVSEKYRMFACIQIDNKRTKEGWRLLKKAIRLNPFSLINYQTLIYLGKASLFK